MRERNIGENTKKIHKIDSESWLLYTGLVFKETDVERIRTIAGCRAVNLEENALREGRRKIVVECMK